MVTNTSAGQGGPETVVKTGDRVSYGPLRGVAVAPAPGLRRWYFRSLASWVETGSPEDLDLTDERAASLALAWSQVLGRGGEQCVK